MSGPANITAALLNGTTGLGSLVITGGWDDQTRQDPTITMTVPATMFACGVFGNLLAIIVLLRSSNEHKQTVFYHLVGALACTDLLGICALSPITLAVYANNLNWVGGDALCNFESFMMIFAGFSTILIVGFMAVDRFLAIKYPFFYEQHVSISRARLGIIAIWLLAILMGCLPLMGFGETVRQFPGSWCFFTFVSTKVLNQIFAYGYASIGLCVITATGLSNVFVTLVLLKMRRKAARSMNLRTTRRHDSELQMMVLLLGIIVIFSTCWCPFMIRIFINQSNFKQVDRKADLIAVRLASLNQILDPWVYILFRKELFVRVFGFLRRRMHVKWACIHFHRDRGNQETRDAEHGKLQEDDHNSDSHDNDTDSETEKDKSKLEKTKSNGFNKSPGYCSKKSPRNSFKKSPSNSFKKSPGNSFKRSPGYKKTSKDYQSELSDNVEESVGLRQVSGRHGIHLKHSSCLFCLSNHAKTVYLSSIHESRSMETLSLIEDKDTESGVDHLCHIHITDGRRGSIHLSLTELRC